MVSVFMRILEYYQVILTLTSSWVGTFDEAFKSRIQLSLHYDKPKISQRCRIWRNFIEWPLRAVGEKDGDLSNPADRIEELVGHDMNGRNIRNVITTGR
ncbi:hypothetical protein MCOR25_003643 [Pyricularia grisea]|nr:hypothetical protein MCOR25_003643 [Pyricularia grisea]